MSALVFVEIVAFVIDHEIEHKTFRKIGGLVEDESSVCNASTKHHELKATHLGERGQAEQ